MELLGREAIDDEVGREDATLETEIEDLLLETDRLELVEETRDETTDEVVEEPARDEMLEELGRRVELEEALLDTEAIELSDRTEVLGPRETEVEPLAEERVLVAEMVAELSDFVELLRVGLAETEPLEDEPVPDAETIGELAEDVSLFGLEAEEEDTEGRLMDKLEVEPIPEEALTVIELEGSLLDAEAVELANTPELVGCEATEDIPEPDTVPEEATIGVELDTPLAVEVTELPVGTLTDREGVDARLVEDFVCGSELSLDREATELAETKVLVGLETEAEEYGDVDSAADTVEESALFDSELTMSELDAEDGSATRVDDGAGLSTKELDSITTTLDEASTEGVGEGEGVALGKLTHDTS